MRISEQSLFIPDLGQDFRSDALNHRPCGGDVTTMAVGEEGGGDVTTLALGEEACAGADLGGGPTQLEKLLELFVRDLAR